MVAASVVDPDSVGSVSFGRIRIVNWENGSGTDTGSEKNDKNIRILYYFFNKSLFWLIHISE